MMAPRWFSDNEIRYNINADSRFAKRFYSKQTAAQKQNALAMNAHWNRAEPGSAEHEARAELAGFENFCHHIKLIGKNKNERRPQNNAGKMIMCQHLHRLQCLPNTCASRAEQASSFPVRAACTTTGVCNEAKKSTYGRFS